MKSSKDFLEARQLLDEARKRNFSEDLLRDKSVELAALILNVALAGQTRVEKEEQQEVAGMIQDVNGKAFAIAVADQCFRSEQSGRIAKQVVHLLKTLGTPKFLTWGNRMKLHCFKKFAGVFSKPFVSIMRFMLRKDMEHVILPAEGKRLKQHVVQRRREGIRLNINHLGEAILGEEEAQKRLSIYLKTLSEDTVEYVSVKISTIYSQINVLAYDETVELLAERLRLLYRTAIRSPYKLADGTDCSKFVNLDMEEYKDLHLTLHVFRKVLSEHEFTDYHAGIVLQAYLPDSYLLLQELTVWAMQRVAKGGAPIKVRIVKGANLAMERVEASAQHWAQAPYESKCDVDANFKRMMLYAMEREHIRAVHIGIASHNLFDISLAMLVRARNGVEKEAQFEMLEGMATHLSRVIQELSGGMLLYCPIAHKEEIQYAIGYLIRRFDENTNANNFLRDLFTIRTGSPEWNKQAEMFCTAFEKMERVGTNPNRGQNRQEEPEVLSLDIPFQNEANTDWNLAANREWVERLIATWKERKHADIPIVIDGKTTTCTEFAEGKDPSHPGAILYRYSKATETHVEIALHCAVKAHAVWNQKPVKERSAILANVAYWMRKHRGDLIGVMVADAGKTVMEADVEISEAIDFAEYYYKSVEKWHEMPDLEWQGKGPIFVVPPWNFPCAIPAGGILAALAAGNSVIFKPARETTLVAWLLASIFWRAGVPRTVLQFVTGESSIIGTKIITDERIAGVVLTGSTETAKRMMKMRHGVHLMAETGGKNALIVTNLADRDLAIKDLVYSAFGHAGQKCSAASLAILEAEVYDDTNFIAQLRDAAQSLKVGKSWDLKTKMNPMIHEPDEKLLRGLTILDEGEMWLLKPKQDPDNPCLWSPGIKWGVRANSFMHQTELFGPVLSVMRADDLDHAILLANGTPFGLTGGIHSLDLREQEYWMQHIEVGNAYINRAVTGAIVQRQPFGGCKESCFGPGAKAGGPNYVTQFMTPTQVKSPPDRSPINAIAAKLLAYMEEHDYAKKELRRWIKSSESYAYWWNLMQKKSDVSLLIGQDNFFSYLPRKVITVRLDAKVDLCDLFCVVSACVTCGCKLELSVEPSAKERFPKSLLSLLCAQVTWREESLEDFCERVRSGKIKRIRFLSTPADAVYAAACESAAHIESSPVLANGRVELLHYLREFSASIDYHRYGNLGLREEELRSELVVGQTASSVLFK